MFDEAFDNIKKESSEKIINFIVEFHKYALFIEISHNDIFVNDGKEVFIESFKQM